MEINKNIAVWRGNSAPPTQYHLWQKGDALLHYNGTEWVLNNFPISTPDEDGLMSKEDKAKLDNLVYDGVDSDRGDIALSARQGRILSEKITDLNTYVYKPKGSVQEIQDLPLDNLRIGDVYNVVNPFYIQDQKYPGGTNVVWTGEQWDPLGGTVDFSDYYTKEEVNDINTDITDAINNEISRATEAEQELKDSKINKSEKGTANGVATLDSSGSIPQEQLPGLYEGTSLKSFSSYMVPINLSKLTASELISYSNEVPVGHIVLALITDSKGNIPSTTETRININSEITSMVGVKGANVGDAFIIGRLSESQPIFKVLPLFNAKIAENGFYGTEGVMTPSDKMRINKVDALETTVNSIINDGISLKVYVLSNIVKEDTKEIVNYYPCAIFIDEIPEGVNDSFGLSKYVDSILIMNQKLDNEATILTQQGSSNDLINIKGQLFGTYNDTIFDVFIGGNNCYISPIFDGACLIDFNVPSNFDALDAYSKYIPVELSIGGKTVTGNLLSVAHNTVDPTKYVIQQYLISDNTFNKNIYYRNIFKDISNNTKSFTDWKLIAEEVSINTNNMSMILESNSCIGMNYYGMSRAVINGNEFSGNILSKYMYDPYRGVTTQLFFPSGKSSVYLRTLVDSEVSQDWTLLNDTSLDEITYNRLLSYRNGSKLTPGKKYRIIDYRTTTTQVDTQSAGHQFDVIVVALSENTLSEDAYVIAHEGDTYFVNSDLNSWKIKYCLDNDTTRFAWADSTNGKGVIYYMKDEYNNECPYDFKNIQFKRYVLDPDNAVKTNAGIDTDLLFVKEKLKNISHKIHTSLWYYGEYVSDVYPTADTTAKYVPFGDIEYNFDGPTVLCKINEDNFSWYYTFESGSGDSSLTMQSNVQNNIIKQSNMVFEIEEGVGIISSNKGCLCLNNIIFFGNDYYSNTFGNDCHSNTFGSYCYSNIFGSYCYYNTFGNGCSSNTFGNNCYSNTFGNNCYSNTFGNGCSSNTFGSYCYSNTFGNDCYFNTFNKDKGGYVNYVIIENGNRYITLNSNSTASSSNKLQNITIAQGYNNTDSKVNITHPTFNDTFKTTYQNPNSKVVEFKDGTRVEYNLSVLKAAIDSKVDKIEGKGLSTNDYTTEDKNKLDNLSDRVSQIQAATDAEIDTIFTEGIA